MPDEPAPSPALLAALRLVAADLAPGALDDEADAAELWLEAAAELCPDEALVRLRAGVEAAAAALAAQGARPLLLVITIGPDGLPQSRTVLLPHVVVLRTSATFLARDVPRHDLLALDGQIEPKLCVVLPLNPREVSRRRRPSLGELRHYVAAQLVPRLGDVRRLPRAASTSGR